MESNEAARKKFQDLTVKDAFMFAAVMSDEVQCRRFLELVLEMDILEVTVITEKTMTYHPEYRGGTFRCPGEGKRKEQAV